MHLEWERLEKAEKRKQTGARLALQRIAKQRRFISRTAVIAVLAILFSLISLFVIAFEAATSFSALFVPAAETAGGEETIGMVVLAGVACVAALLLGLAAFGGYILFWSSRKRHALQREEEAVRTGLEFQEKRQDLRPKGGSQ